MLVEIRKSSVHQLIHTLLCRTIYRCISNILLLQLSSGTCTSIASGIKLFVEWFKIYHSNKMDNKRRAAKKELDTKLLNQEIDDKNKQFNERLKLLQKK